MTTLADLCRMGGWELRRDADIGSLGFIDVPLERRLVFACDLRNVRFALAADGIAAVLTTPELAALVTNETIGLGVVADPSRAFVSLHNRLVDGEFYGPPHRTTINSSAEVHQSAHVDPIGVAIGPDCRVEPGASILEGTELGTGVRVMAGAVIGSEGFQSLRLTDRILDFRHAGRVRIGDRAVVFANAVIARAVFRQVTTIGTDCRIGNGAFVSHNCQIGDRTLVGHGAVIAGNCRIGSDVTIGPGAICMDRLELGDGCFVTGGAVVVRSVLPRERVTGNFATEHRQHLRHQSRRTLRRIAD